jgi:hypothetical protein
MVRRLFKDRLHLPFHRVLEYARQSTTICLFALHLIIDYVCGKRENPRWSHDYVPGAHLDSGTVAYIYKDVH